MANNTTYTAGSGTTIATDDVAGVHYQLVKLVDGAEDSAARIGGDAANGLDVDVTRLPALVAGEAHVGAVGGGLVSVSVEFTRPADTTAYAAGDAVSDSTSTTTMQNAASFARVSGGSGYIVGARLTTDKKSIVPRIRVHLFNATGATLAADNAAYKSLYADVAKRIAYFDLPALATPADTTNSTESRAIDMGLRIPFVAVSSTSIYWVLETLDAFTPASGEKFTLTLTADLN